MKTGRAACPAGAMSCRNGAPMIFAGRSTRGRLWPIRSGIRSGAAASAWRSAGQRGRPQAPTSSSRAGGRASLHDRRPRRHPRSPGAQLTRRAAAARNSARTSAATTRMALPEPRPTWLPAVKPSSGAASVSPAAYRSSPANQSSSSAAICTRAVRMPWPIRPCRCRAARGPAREAEPSRQTRVVLQAARSSSCRSLPHRSGRALHRADDAVVRAATTEMPVERLPRRRADGSGSGSMSALARSGCRTGSSRIGRPVRQQERCLQGMRPLGRPEALDGQD